MVIIYPEQIKKALRKAITKDLSFKYQNNLFKPNKVYNVIVDVVEPFKLENNIFSCKLYADYPLENGDIVNAQFSTFNTTFSIKDDGEIVISQPIILIKI